MPDVRLLTVTEAAARLGRSRQWFYDNVLADVETRWVAGRRYVLSSSLDEWVRRGEDAA